VYSSITRLPEITCPLLIIHGDCDTLIPFEEGLSLFEESNEPKDLFVVEGAGHNDVSMRAGPRYGEFIRSWLEGSHAES
jgi:hypothetical protein